MDLCIPNISIFKELIIELVKGSILFLSIFRVSSIDNFNYHKKHKLYNIAQTFYKLYISFVLNASIIIHNDSKESPNYH